MLAFQIMRDGVIVDWSGFLEGVWKGDGRVGRA
jgi:hypothetical protein